ncbi:Excinuclease ABC subunit A [Ferrithrix thermotolerans DSM 19514]|uniref:UvrABC system protein A n=1 Tax=Ferrithrix thermotolerans DSM 19514 TaxID=1121881 RepID=A0A1M4SCP1_9ACTN|nr:excinuclease ABC subunit UvrA [Ferrithrix thermotolerans]SHE29895.1 Excinuclease ABC subunit A [Ferrithrix thermotolerans DSM 19514]
MPEKIYVKGAREHNLKDIDVEIPRDKLSVFTGLSGSGKSSLAFDTIFAEGQRRYVESLSAYARQFLGLMEKPDVDFIDGLSPAISIDQKSTSKNPRSTVGTVTEIYDYLRLLYARVGIPHCPNCKAEVYRQTPQEIVDRVLGLEERTRALIVAPIVRGRKGEYSALLDELSKKGFARVLVDNIMYELSERKNIHLARYEMHDISVVVDRLVVNDKQQRRITDSVETALSLSQGTVEVHILGEEGADATVMSFSEELACARCGISLGSMEPRNFSFNTPYGACPGCDGIGTKFEVDPDLVVADPSLSLLQGVIAPWANQRSTYFERLVESVAKEHGIPLNVPWSKLSKKHRDILLYGVEEPVVLTYSSRYGGKRTFSMNYEGVVPYLHRRHSEAESDAARLQVEGYMREVSCPDCNGARLRPESLTVTVDGMNIFEFTSLSVTGELKKVLSLSLTDREWSIARQVVKEVSGRLQFLEDVGLGYLTLTRAARTLSGGEAQRIRLASQIGSGLAGVLYVLDEPSIGLHQRDNRRLIETLLKLRDQGNTVIVVEHDDETIRAADYVVDVGPGAGEYGGYVVYSGDVEGLCNHKESITGRYLSGEMRVEVPLTRRRSTLGSIRVVGARENNLKGIDVEFPLGVFTAVTGVAGSGKSTLVNEILLKALRASVYGSKEVPGRHRKVTGTETIDKVVDIDQSPIGRTPRSNPATYSGVFDHIRKLFAQTQDARARGYMPGRFSFNVKGGRCEACNGDGTLKIEMNFLPDVYVTCEVCKGARYNRDTLEVQWKGKNISEVLSMPITEALDFFANQPSVTRHLETLDKVGLGYVRLGQSATTLSGGEAQRVKLAAELAKRPTGHTLYILDEPTTGLHFEDVRKLLLVLHSLVDQGNTVVVIEHNLDVVKTADWIIDLGPEGGDLGGEIVVEGTPETVANSGLGYTSSYLKQVLSS